MKSIAIKLSTSESLPAQSIGAGAILTSGDFSLVDVINDIPALVNSTSSDLARG
jgi:hypothetical protein